MSTPFDCGRRVRGPDSKSTVETVRIDIEDDESIKQAFETINEKYGKLDILLNNAGQCMRHSNGS